MASAADIRSWSATGLAARTVAQLQALATTTGVDLLDVNDASRGSRRGRPLLKADYISSLLRHRDQLAAAATSDAAATDDGLAVHNIVQFRPAGSSGWSLAT